MLRCRRTIRARFRTSEPLKCMRTAAFKADVTNDIDFDWSCDDLAKTVRSLGIKR